VAEPCLTEAEHALVKRCLSAGTKAELAYLDGEWKHVLPGCKDHPFSGAAFTAFVNKAVNAIDPAGGYRICGRESCLTADQVANVTACIRGQACGYTASQLAALSRKPICGGVARTFLGPYVSTTDCNATNRAITDYCETSYQPGFMNAALAEGRAGIDPRMNAMCWMAKSDVPLYRSILSSCGSKASATVERASVLSNPWLWGIAAVAVAGAFAWRARK